MTTLFWCWTSNYPTPLGDFDKVNHNNGKTLNFSPHMHMESILTVKFKEYFCLQIKEWEITLISYIIGDNTYELQMLEYVKKVWVLLKCPRCYIMMINTLYLNFLTYMKNKMSCRLDPISLETGRWFWETTIWILKWVLIFLAKFQFG